MAWALVGVMAALLGVSVTTIGILFRRNGKPQNPNFETLEVLSKQQLRALEGIDARLDRLLEVLTEVKTTVRGCPTVQRMTGASQ